MGSAKARHWAFTLNNHTVHEEAALPDASDKVRYLIYGREVGETGTPHLQGHVQFRDQQRAAAVKRLLGTDRVHIEVARSPLASVEYCKKSGDFTEKGSLQMSGRRNDLDEFKAEAQSGKLTLKEVREKHSAVYAKYPRFVIEYLQDHYPVKEIEAHALRPWQANLVERLRLPPDDRSIVFVVDPTGNNGKTWFSQHIAKSFENVQILPPSKRNDMAYALDPTIRILFLDAPRSKQGEYIQYDFLEDVKNGYVFSPKYESRVKTLKRVHVVVLMNEQPDMEKLSADRYVIINI